MRLYDCNRFQVFSELDIENVAEVEVRASPDTVD